MLTRLLGCPLTLCPDPQTPTNCSGFFPAPMLGLMLPGPVPLLPDGKRPNTTTLEICSKFFAGTSVRLWDIRRLA